MTASPILALGLLLVTGLLFGLLVSRINMPRIAAYALAGLIWSEDLLGGYLGLDITEWSHSLTNIALSIIAYTIGGSVTMEQLRRLGKIITFCTVGESLGAVLVVTLAVYFYQPAIDGPVWVFALILGVLAATTAPAATVAVIHQYRAKGLLTTSLLGVVALDDVLGIILFSVMLVVVTGLSLTDAVINSGVEIVGSIGLGIVIGWLLTFFGHKIRNQNFLLPTVLSALFLSQGLSELWHFSPLLTAVIVGFSARSVYKSSGERLFAPVEYLEELVFIIFFTLAGAHFKLSVFLQVTDLVVIYVFARVIGKFIGIRIGAKLSHAPEVVSKYLGFGVIPQAGIAIGLALSLLQIAEFQNIALLVLNVILASTLIYEIIGPLATRYALFKAGEAKP
ncbi:MAG: cation:proton antiporter [Piscirickettsiaceae bacterium]|nr:cation:proton antiporter [Piscirickettsiaceae bacterium]